MWIGISITFFVLLLISVFVVKNLLAKVEKYEEDIEYKQEFIEKIIECINISNDTIMKLDMAKAFESDDEAGVFFKKMKDIQFYLSSYATNYSIPVEESKKEK